MKGRKTSFVNVTCDKCNKRYSIADDKVRGKSVKIRCKQCQNLISLQGPASGPVAAEVGRGAAAAAVAASPWGDNEATRAMPALDPGVQWFAMVKGKQLGPLDLKGLEGKVKTGELTLRTYLWKQGMGDWTRASDVPEVSPVFAGVSVGATATGPTSAVSERPSSKKVAPVQRDVAVALETPLPEITGRHGGNGNGHGPAAESATQPTPRTKVASQSRAPVAAKPAPAAEPQPAPVDDRALADLFGDHEHTAPSDHGPIGTLDNDPDGEDEVPSQPNDPFAALGPGDPGQVPAVGEATKFFIAQAGVNKRNPPWKIALFIIGGPGLILGTLFLLSTLEIVPLQVTRMNEKGEEVQESFFSAGGVTGIKDLFSGEAKKRKAEAEAAKQAAAAAAEKRKQAALANRAATDKTPTDKPPEARPVDAAAAAELALIYGTNSPAESGSKGPRVRAEDRPNQKTLDSSGLSQEASQKVIADKLKGFEACVEQALRRNPNLAVGPIDVVLNVGASGAVTSATIAPAKHNNSDWGMCMRDVAKRIVFPKSDGETEVSLPLKVGVAMSP